jgi:hypothetical protein
MSLAREISAMATLARAIHVLTERPLVALDDVQLACATARRALNASASTRAADGSGGRDRV